MNDISFTPKRLLVTGGAGFIGANLVHWLWGNKEVTGQLEKLVVLDALTYAGNLLSLEGLPIPDGRKSDHIFVKGDICDPALVATVLEEHQIDSVLHLAAESHVDRSIEDGASFVKTNVLGTFTLLDACRRAWGDAEGRRFVLVSTDEVYGALGHDGEFTETTPYAPNSPYAASKAGADHLGRAFHKTYGMDVVITNCSNNYGPRQFPEKLIPLMIRNARSGEKLPVYGEGKQVRDWLHVEDHCRGLWTALVRGQAGEKYNFGGGTELPNLEVVHRIADSVDAALKREPGTARKQITFVPDRPGHDFRYAIDPTKSKSELGWEPQHDFEQGLADTVAWYFEHNDWVEATISGEYQRFYDANYAQRDG
jgi:dTDP-glucose 4,6-dehydratase